MAAFLRIAYGASALMWCWITYLMADALWEHRPALAVAAIAAGITVVGGLARQAVRTNDA